MKKNYLISICTILLLMPNLVNVGAIVDSTPIWQVTENTNMVYEITDLAYNDSDYWPMNQYDEFTNETYPVGEMYSGDLFFARIEKLPDLSSSDEDVRLSLDASRITESWEHNYSYVMDYDWPAEANGPVFFMPVVTVPVDAAFWYNRATSWNAHGDFTATYNATTQTFSLAAGANTTLGVESVHVIWDTNTGVMIYYNGTGTEGENDVPFNLEMSFMYFRDESQWGLDWQINTGEMYAFRWDIIEGVSSIEFGGTEENEDTYVYEGDLMIFNLWQLSDPAGEDGMYWNATAITPEWEAEFNFEFSDIGESDGPLTWYPFMPVGNENFINNITDEFEAFGATVTVTSNILNITYIGPESSESAEWDLTTGIMQKMIYDGPVAENTTAYIELSFVYHFAPGGEPLFASDDFEERYVMDDITNGTDDFLDFGMVGDYYYDNGTRYWKPFKLYEGDVMQTSVHREMYWNEEEMQNEWRFRWYGRTTSGYETNAWIDYSLPGLEVHNDGPPALMFVINTGTETITGDPWWNTLEGIYNDLGYTVTNTEVEFGFATSTLDFSIVARWDKGTGLLNFYSVTGVDSETGNDVAWIMHRSAFNIRGGEGLSWGIDVGTTMNYTFSDITTPIPFGDHETGSIDNGDIMHVTFRQLGDLQNDGPFVNVDMEVGGVTQLNTSMGLRTPGFEFVEFEEDENRGGGPPLLYFAIPKGPEHFWNTIQGMYSDVGYGTLNNDTHFGVFISQDDIDVEVYWAKDTSLMVYYHLDGMFDGQQMTFTAVLKGSEVVEPTGTTTTETTTTSTTGETTSESVSLGVPAGYSFIVGIPIAAIIYKKKKYM